MKAEEYYFYYSLFQLELRAVYLGVGPYQYSTCPQLHFYLSHFYMLQHNYVCRLLFPSLLYFIYILCSVCAPVCVCVCKSTVSLIFLLYSRQSILIPQVLGLYLPYSLLQKFFLTHNQLYYRSGILFPVIRLLVPLTNAQIREKEPFHLSCTTRKLIYFLF